MLLKDCIYVVSVKGLATNFRTDVSCTAANLQDQISAVL